MLRLQMKIEDETSGTQLAHSGSMAFSPEKLTDPATVQLAQLQAHAILIAATQPVTLPSAPTSPIDTRGATKLREFAALVESGKYITSFEKIADPNGNQRFILTLSPTRI